MPAVGGGSGCLWGGALPAIHQAKVGSDGGELDRQNSLPVLQEAAGEGPDLMAFYRAEELFTETPFLEVGGLPPLKLQAQRRHPATTFLMYRKLQQWAS